MGGCPRGRGLGCSHVHAAAGTQLIGQDPLGPLRSRPTRPGAVYGSASHTSGGRSHSQSPLPSSSRRRPMRVTQSPAADDRCRDREEIREDNPLDVLERGVERHGKRRQASVGDAGVERGHQHGEGKARERPRHRSCPVPLSVCRLDISFDLQSLSRYTRRRQRPRAFSKRRFKRRSRRVEARVVLMSPRGRAMKSWTLPVFS